jgi:subtilase family serine protease
MGTPKRARPLAMVILAGGVLVAGCTGSSHSPAAAGSPAAAQGSTTAHSPATVTTVVSAAGPAVAAPSGVALPCQLSSCYSPRQIGVAYGIQPLLDKGIDGRGETVTVVVNVPLADQDPTDVRQDLASFDSTFRLPPVRIEVVTSLGGAASPWQAAGEEVGDIEHVHAVAPAATLRVVLFPSSWSQSPANATGDMLAALRLAVSHTDVVSVSWSLGEHYFTKAQAAEMHSILEGAAAHHVTVIASSGDNGPFSDQWFGHTPVQEVSLPASDPFVLSVGGTTLTLNPKTGAYLSETTWPNGGGGVSHLYARPAYQDGVPGISTTRGVPDVAADAEAIGGMALVFTGNGGGPYLDSPAGTSGATPLWAGLVALADQDAHHDLGFINPAIYGIARGAGYHRAFHDITTGANGYLAGPGWDPATGWGTPNAQVLVPLLARTTPGTT